MAAAYDGDFPDPEVIRVGDEYYAYATQAGSTNVQLLTSPDMAGWQHLGDALPSLPGWAGSGFTWAPAVLRRDAGFVLYYTVREPGSGRQCISLATADGAGGPFVDTSAQPLIFQLDRGGSIDPCAFTDGDGTPYLLWKSDDNALNRPTSLWGQGLAADSLSLVGDPVELLRQDQGWEAPLIEGPAMWLSGSTYFLFYSANWWESADYAIGYGTGPSPLGPFEKVTRSGPWVASHGDEAGPGGPSLFTDPESRPHMAYHAWTPGTVGYAQGGARSLRIHPLDFAEGRPALRR